MRVEDLQVSLRPRTGWEAVDLGFVMAREWWKPVWGAWLVAYLPLGLALVAAFWKHPFYASLIMWWLKPVFDRVVLHVVSRAVFGDVPSIGAAVRAPDVLRPGLADALTLGRISAARSLLLPVAQLEGLTGRAARQRRAALGRRDRGYAVGLTVVCIHLELVILLGLDIVGTLLVPAAGTVVPDLSGWFAGAGDGEWWSVTDAVLYLIAVSVVEPLYVAGGFALYLNRRTLLEGWDIEVALRGLAQRLAAKVRVPAVAIALAVAAAVALAPHAGEANAAEKSARAEIREVLKAPEFPQPRDERVFVRRDLPKDDAAPPDFTLVARVVQALGWIAAAVAVAVLLYVAWRYARTLTFARRADGYRPPDTLFGLAVAPESLPDDVAGTAARLAAEGRLREALSLLYRGALSALVHRHHVALEAGDTEGDCMRRADRALPAAAARYFGVLVAAWQSAAYAGRLPDAARVASLAADWRSHFEAPPATGAA